ncbi:hypothetical protein L6164_024736 [Bauhinia variegata]|uniref:Uncharacterized protein n=1 Tax=Bauhinia variegata TaxID=167791 RepID=A0ACB9LYP8_BAUVA|nr:hypothetical protein L6164_024736 [Bauhinia variegata]
MPVVTKLKPCARPVTEPRAVLGPAGNRQEPKRKKEVPKKPQCQTDKVSEIPESIVQINASVDSSYFSDSSPTNSTAKSVESRKTVKRNGFKPVKVVPYGVHAVALSPKDLGPAKRCDWITPNSDPLYTAFHDEEWGVPVKDDRKLFELLVFSQALAEHRWPAILNQRDIFRKLFENFDPSSIFQFTEKNLQMLKVNDTPLLSDPKLRAIVENAKQLLKVQKEFGSFSNYCWRFVNQKPIRNQFRYGRQVPVKTPKAEAISKDMMRRGFQCVGPTVVYSFMQVAGLVNDHLVTCFRYQECTVATTKVEEKVVENNETSVQAQIH